MAASIALAESGGNPNAINNNNPNGTIDRGLWQINSVHGSQSTLDPLANARAAVAISHGGTNWRPWCTAWSNGACGGTYLGQGAPVYRTLPAGTPTVSGSQAANAGTGTQPTNAVLTSTGPLPDWLNTVLSYFGFDVNDTVRGLFATTGYILLVFLGFGAMGFGVLLLVLQSRAVAIAGQLGGQGVQAYLGGKYFAKGAAAGVVKNPAPAPAPAPAVGRAPVTPASPPPAPAIGRAPVRPDPLFGIPSREGRARLAADEDALRAGMVKPPRTRALRRTPRPPTPDYEGSRRSGPGRPSFFGDEGL
jgi:hypothetical protein